MKKLNLFLIPVLFSSLLIGCGMKGPLYRVPEKQPIKEQSTAPEKILIEQASETLQSE